MIPIRSNIPFNDNRFLMFVIDAMANEYDQIYDDVIRMTLGKSELPVCDSILHAMNEALNTFSTSSLVFPSGLPQLKKKIADYYKKNHTVDINPDNIVISVGTSTLFRNIFQLLANEDDEILLPLPYYPLYQFCAMLTGATIRYYTIDIETMNIDMESMARNLTPKTKIVVINSPGNPLGNIVSSETLQAIDSLVAGRAVCISDEIYQNVSFDGHSPSSCELSNPISTWICTNSFSKGYRMYSRRVGYAIVPQELVEPLTVIQHHTLLTTDPVPQFGAIAALDHPEEVEYLTSLYCSRRDYTCQKFTTIPDVHAIRAAGSFYFTLECSEFMRKHEIDSSLKLAQLIMEQTHVATVPGSDFGLPQTLRLSYSSLRYNEGIDRLVEFFKAPVLGPTRAESASYG